MVSEVTLLRLPPQLSEAVDQAVDQFAKQRRDGGVTAYRRWHGADTWMVTARQPSNEDGAAFVERRVTAGAYSDDPDRLAFIPDIVVTKPEGRYVLPPERRKSAQERLGVSIFEFMVALATQGGPSAMRSEPAVREQLLSPIRQTLDRAWSAAAEFKSDEATVLLP